ncbi:nucleotidyl transferase AbiEii/AbiGii toxin family protein [Chryseobacterium sp. CCH4-E10]|uniref:nucleotidyl transferase AbiEii/AbiGii toxin family protein n=1 Tax=Chryseobacterium sp. CCH4-E10 TaxID=1768758 RepID=UPI00083296BD|nr:nucleotidyl transferase AbiEii/AbiGii toxin family protein [Chryseobacterium sp. CCH4-E10]
MISKDSLTTEWLNSVSVKNNRADKILIEKVIRALLLLEGLVKSDVQFVFKGGTALMLFMNSTKRLSIDIDVIISNPKQNLEEKFQGFLSEQGFTRFEEQHRQTSRDIEKAHYKFFYTPVHMSNMTEDYVLLDILFEEPHYTKIINFPIDSSFIKQDGDPINVSIPCHEDILGDKLTAFAPNTTGIPYEKGGDSRTMEIMKQLFDIGSLLEPVTDVSIIGRTFDIFAKTEIGYRNCQTDENGVLDDIYDTALHICSRGEKGKGDFKALSAGITQVKRFIFSESYHLDRAITDAAKAAYLATVLRYKVKKLKKYQGLESIKQLVIDQEFDSKLNKLKKGNPEAFLYWYHVSLIRQQKQ